MAANDGESGAAEVAAHHVRGDTIGRFVVLGLVGAGGMGEVYAAYDPDLDRKVAVKLVRPSASLAARDHARLLREAQAAAKLSHPNVVVVYEVGKVGEAVFIAMEYVDGETLGVWAAAVKPSWREILRVFGLAGRGLSAAHDAGLVHRDFKPDNVMVTASGLVRVMDFGLARKFDGSMDAERAPPVSGSRPLVEITADLRDAGAASRADTPNYLSSKLTETGARMGTPAYMAPEQFTLDHPVDARSDQFSFCVALYEALYGERPFGGQTLLALMTSVAEMNVRPPPARAHVPGWIRRALLRGLATEPQARFSSMAALLQALELDPSVRRRRWALTGAAVMGMGALAIVVGRAGDASRSMCTGGPGRLVGIWEGKGAPSARKDSIRAAFAKIGKSYAMASYAGAARLLDDYAEGWLSRHREACEATNVRGEQSAEVLDLRMECLNDRLRNLQATTDLFASADDGIVRNAVTAAGSLPLLEACDDVVSLRQVVRLPQDPAAQHRIGELREEAARVAALVVSGQCGAAEARGSRLIDAARAVGYQPLLASVLSTVGLLGNFCGDPKIAVARLKEGYAAAVAGREDNEATNTASSVVVLSAGRLGDAGSARDWALITRASLRRQNSNERFEAWALTAEASLAILEGDAAGAVEKGREAWVLTKKVLGADHPRSLEGLMNIGDYLFEMGRYEEALAADLEALAAAQRVYGPVHDVVAADLSNTCEVLNHLGRFSEARAACERGLAIWREIGAGSVIRAYGQTGLGIALLGEGHPSAAVAPLEEAVASRRDGKVRPTLLGESRFALARSLWPSNPPRAIALARQARVDSRERASAVATIDAWLAKSVSR